MSDMDSKRMGEEAEAWIAEWCANTASGNLRANMLREAMRWAYRDAAKVAKDLYGGRAHTYASENADTYRIQDQTLASCAKVILDRAK